MAIIETILNGVFWTVIASAAGCVGMGTLIIASALNNYVSFVIEQDRDEKDRNEKDHPPHARTDGFLVGGAPEGQKSH